MFAVTCWETVITAVVACASVALLLWHPGRYNIVKRVAGMQGKEWLAPLMLVKTDVPTEALWSGEPICSPLEL
jgi:hypothetical protein